MLALHEPGSEPVADKIKLAILDCHSNFRHNFVDKVTHANRKPNPAASIPVFTALLEAESTYEKPNETMA